MTPTGKATHKLATATPWLLLDISRSQWYRLYDSGRTPLPAARLGTRKPVYRVAELESWLAAGCPDRETWQRMYKG
jgi:hypothetical protein